MNSVLESMYGWTVVVDQMYGKEQAVGKPFLSVFVLMTKPLVITQ